MARAYPASFFTGSDYHEESVIAARKQVAEAAWPPGCGSRSPRRRPSKAARTTW
jgi:hypothetical protein